MSGRVQARGRGFAPARALVTAALLVGCPLLIGCRGRGEAAGVPGPFAKAPVVLISIDTLRSDRLPAYGYRKVATPALDALRGDSVLFARAYSNVPLTLPSHASLFSGRLPGHHGVRDNSGYRFRAERTPYLPALLHDAGYRTGGAVSAFVLRAETGLATGFDAYDSSIDVRASESLGNSQRPGKQTVHSALAWLRGADLESQPFFLFVHLYEPHTPYAPDEPFKSRYADPYDGEVATADAAVGELLAALRERGVYDRALIVLLSDHGEGLRDHGEQEHGILLYREALQVPLLVKLPGNERGGSTVEEPAQLVDVAPTVLALLGMPVPPQSDGEPLFGRAADSPPRSLYAETFYPRLHLGWNELASVIRGDSHYIEGPAPELYDLASDPAEKRDVLRTERRTYAALKAEAARFSVPLAAPAEEDPETARQLAALGYIATAAAKVGDGALPDPKSQISTLDDLGRALQAFAQQQYAQAVPLFQALLAKNPLMLDAWENLGTSLQKLGRQKEALAAFQRAMELSGGSTHVALGTGNVLLDMGRFDEAAEHAKLGLDTSPAVAHDLLARIALARGDLPAAEREARQALEARGSRLGPLMTMASIQVKAEKLDEALRLLDEAEAGRDPAVKMAGLQLLRGDVLARLGRPADAEQAFRREIADFPADPPAYSRLALLYASEGQPDAAVATLRALVEGQGSPGAYATAVKTLRILGDPRGAAALLRRALAAYPQSQELRDLAG
jgi:arylsulfatase A-like enzyme/Tfp pilus assembly protein PilF